MMKRKVLVSAPYLLPVIQHFVPLFRENGIEIIVPPVNERLEEDELLKYIDDIDGAICGDDRFTARVLRSALKLKVISKWGTGIDSIDLKACRDARIRVCNTPNAFSEPVADSVLGYMLCFSRNLVQMDSNMKSGEWKKIPCKALRECTLGVIGVGNVGKAVVRRATAFGMSILGNDIVELPKDFLLETDIRMVAKEDLLCESDFVSLNCDLNPSSYHLMNYKMFCLMKPSAVVINTARGPIIKEEDLIKALNEKRIGGAALDVFEFEPLPDDSPLKEMPNVMLAPHNANSSPKIWEFVHHNTIQNLIKALNGDS
jgi:D-3-phosphoglycerate dehydrogenase / 2-oxoglutarate reductase